MEAIKINLEDYIHSGEGANGESFDHRTDPSIMMKLYNPGKDSAAPGRDAHGPEGV